MASEATNNGEERGESQAAPEVVAQEPLLVLEHLSKSFGASRPVGRFDRAPFR